MRGDGKAVFATCTVLATGFASAPAESAKFLPPERATACNHISAGVLRELQHRVIAPLAASP